MHCLVTAIVYTMKLLALLFVWPSSGNSLGSRRDTGYRSKVSLSRSASNGQVDCLSAVRTCLNEKGICSVDLDIFNNFCGNWQQDNTLLGCNQRYVNECRAALKTLKFGRLRLANCQCNGKSIADLTGCNLLRHNLNNHPCTSDPPRLGNSLVKQSTTAVPPRQPKRDSRNDPKPQLTRQTDRVGVINHSQFIDNNHGSEQTSPGGVEKLKSTKLTENQPTTTEPKTTVLETPLPDVTTTTQPIYISHIDETTLNVGHPIRNCLQSLNACFQSPSCTLAFNQFRATCTTRSCGRFGSQCLTAYKKLKVFDLHQNCSCNDKVSSERKQRCLDYQALVLSNKCVESALNSSELDDYILPNHFKPYYSRMEKEDGKSTSNTDRSISSVDQYENNSYSKVWKKSTTRNYSTINCFDAFQLCSRDTNCLARYLDLVSACQSPELLSSTDKSACQKRSKACRDALKTFYDDIKDERSMGRKALSCTCSPPDPDCSRQMQILKPNAGRRVIQRESLTCNARLEMCLNHHACRNVYRILSAECSTVSEKCLDNPSWCWQAYRDLWIEMAFLELDEDCDNVSPPSSTVEQTTDFDERQNKAFAVRPGFESELCDQSTDSDPIPPCGVSKNNDNRQLFQEKSRESDVCLLTDRLNLPSDSLVRLDSPQRKAIDLSKSEASICVLLCQCNGDCMHNFCPTGVNSPRHANATRISSCRWLPELNPTCRCIDGGRTGVVLCSTSNSGDLQQPPDLLGYQVSVQYDRKELYAISSMLDNHEPFNNEAAYYSNVLQIGLLFNKLISGRQASCRLVIVAHQEEETIPFLDYDSSTPPAWSRIVFLVESLNHDDPFNSLHCHRALKLLSVMINGRFPHIKNSPILSTIKNIAIDNDTHASSIKLQLQSNSAQFKHRPGVSNSGRRRSRLRKINQSASRIAQPSHQSKASFATNWRQVRSKVAGRTNRASVSFFPPPWFLYISLLTVCAFFVN